MSFLPVAGVSAKLGWLHADTARWATRYGVPFRQNPHFPVNTLMLMRGATGYLRQDEATFLRYADAIFSAMWEQGRNLNDPAEIGAVLAAAGFDPRAALTLVDDPEVKQALKRDTEHAVTRGVFGAPSFIVGDELFWGNDRLLFVEDALARP
ncbi:2-hydroxychromene-2-carboxylate isomerase [Cupriavidus alkaliphilus]|uniref:2-hydroxychromene-2-carboxylate isomerase n=1 Tax=Cupriavidus alkaliphilus TaxID=942866 RepID=A0A7W4VDD2_9BURK|nr:2-hydroxychromene-2-carboxylate isomerase [Cupriavidus alkaliphilus]MBB3009219.1 2-hydroxychromene-2-carboxylate isomerase [Cupriavidus alkaliphilus]